MTKMKSKSNVIIFPKKKSQEKPGCGLCGKSTKLIQTDSSETGSVMIQRSMSCFLMPEIVALGIMIDIHYAVTITQKGIKETGKTVRSVGNLSRQRYTYGMGQTNTTLTSLRIRLLMNLRNVLDAGSSLI